MIECKVLWATSPMELEQKVNGFLKWGVKKIISTQFAFTEKMKNGDAIVCTMVIFYEGGHDE